MQESERLKQVGELEYALANLGLYMEALKRFGGR